MRVSRKLAAVTSAALLLAAAFAEYVSVALGQDPLAHRKSDLTIVVQDAHGQPVQGAELQIIINRHAFRFGSQATDTKFTPGEADYNPEYREKVLENFNHVSLILGFQWQRYLNPNNAQTIQRATRSAIDSGLEVRASSVIWPRDRWPTPTDLRSSASPDPHVFHQRLINERLGAGGIMADFIPGGNPLGVTVEDWKFLNEPMHESYYEDTFVAAGIYGGDIAARVDWFVRAKQTNPNARLMINEYGLWNSTSDANTIAFRDYINVLLAAGAPIDVIGVQGHMARVVSQADMTRRLDLLAETGLPIEITEYDARDDDQVSLTPQQQETLFRSALTAAFEHESVVGFSLWGFRDVDHWRGNGPLYFDDWSVKPQTAPWFDLVHGQWKPYLIGEFTDASGEWHSQGQLFDGEYDITASFGGASTTVSSFELLSDDLLVITVPEPSSVVLVAMALAAFTFLAMRCRDTL